VLITPQELEIHRIVISKAYAPRELDYRGAEFRQVRPLEIKVVAELVANEIHLKGHLKTTLEASCDRCLGRVEMPVNRDLDLFYRPMSTIAREEEVEISPGELDIGFYSGEGIELEDVLSEQVILSVPMKLICRPECQGLCPTCGANRNIQDCHCPATAVDSSFSSLA
jgi:uncharacterized protein